MGTGWPFESYSVVRAYFFNRSGELGKSILRDGLLSPTVMDPQGVELNLIQTARLLGAVFGDHDPHPLTACHLPRHGFIFFGRDGEPIASLDACFECHSIRLHPMAETGYNDWSTLRAVVSELGLPRFENRREYLTLPEPKHALSSLRIGKPVTRVPKLP